MGMKLYLAEQKPTRYDEPFAMLIRAKSREEAFRVAKDNGYYPTCQISRIIVAKPPQGVIVRFYDIMQPKVEWNPKCL